MFSKCVERAVKRYRRYITPNILVSHSIRVCMCQLRFDAAFQPVKLPKISQYTETVFIRYSGLSAMVSNQEKVETVFQQPMGIKQNSSITNILVRHSIRVCIYQLRFGAAFQPVKLLKFPNSLKPSLSDTLVYPELWFIRNGNQEKVKTVFQ